MKRLLNGLLLIVVVMVVGDGVAQAHKVTIFAWAEGDQVFTQSKFSGGKTVKNGKVEVFDTQGEKLMEGRTDDKGEFSFEVPKVADLNIVLTAGMGHQNSWRLSAVDLGAAASAPPPAVAPEAPIQPYPQAEVPGLTAQAVEAIVARQLDQKLQPLTRMMAATQAKGPSASDIFGGIGYILGLVGLGAYVRYRKDGRRP